MPLGRPVDPDEYIQNAISSRSVSACGRSAEKRRRIGWGIIEEHQDAVAALEAQRNQTMPPTAGLGAQLAIGVLAKRAGQREAVGPAFAEIIEQDAASVVLLRDRKADLLDA